VKAARPALPGTRTSDARPARLQPRRGRPARRLAREGLTIDSQTLGDQIGALATVLDA
jgi:hypothetical protein